MKFSLLKFSTFSLVILLTACISNPTTSTTTSDVTPSNSTSIPASSNPSTSLPPSSSEQTTSSEPITATTSEDDRPFVPGHKGALPLFSGNQAVTGTFSGLYVEELDRQPYFFESGSRCEALLRFPTAGDLEATSLRLQYYDTLLTSWVDYGENYVTDYNNFIVVPTGNERVRLVATGGPLDGFVSNEVSLGFTAVDTSFNGYSLDESMMLTGVMSPFVGRGLEASFSVINNDTKDAILTGLSYQWYRVNPYTYEHIEVTGATNLFYTTTIEDAGYYMAIIATGDEIIVGGRYEIISGGEPVSIPVKTFGENATDNGFDLNFEYYLPYFDISSLQIMDSQYAFLNVVSAVLDGAKDTVKITFSEPSNSETFYVTYMGSYFTLVAAGYQMQMIAISR